MESDSIVNKSADFVKIKRKQRLFQSLVAAEIVIVIALIIFLIEGSMDIVYSVVGCSVLISSLFILIKLDKIELGIQLLLIFTTLIMLFFMWFFEGTNDEIILVYPAIVTFALVLGNKNLAIGLLVFLILNILAIGYVNSAGILIHELEPVTFTGAILTTILIILVCYSIWLISSDISELLKTITAENERVAQAKEKIQSLLDNEKRLREQEIEVHKLKNLENIGLLAGGIAHDFNNMLTAILGNISLAKLKLNDNHPSSAYLLNSEQSIERAAQLAGQLLTFAKGGAPKKEVLDITQLVDEAVQFDLTGSSVKPIIKSDAEQYLIDADRAQIRQVISNITINGLQSMESGGLFHVTVQEAVEEDILDYALDAQRYIKIQFTDEGTGMDQETLAKIFDLYFTTKGSGNGLGMTIVNSIIKKHNGVIDIQSEVGKGTTVTVLLPLSVENVPANKQAEPTAIPTNYDLKILILDDDPEILQMVSAMFVEKGAYVSTAQDGSDLIRLYEHSLDVDNPYEVIIFDLTIPGGMGGKEAVVEVKKMNPEALCIVSSGYADDPVMANYSDYGFQAAVSKPYHLEQLYRVVADLTDSEQAS